MLPPSTPQNIEQQHTPHVHTTTDTPQQHTVNTPIDLTVTTPTIDSSRDDMVNFSTLAAYKHAQLRREDAAYYSYSHSPERPMDWVTDLPTPPTHTRHTPMPAHAVSKASYRPNAPKAPPTHTAKPQTLPTTMNALPIIKVVHGSAPAYPNIGYQPTHIVNVVRFAIPTKQTIIPVTPAVTTTTDSTTTTTTVTTTQATIPTLTQQKIPTPPAPVTRTKRTPTTDPQASTQAEIGTATTPNQLIIVIQHTQPVRPYKGTTNWQTFRDHFE